MLLRLSFALGALALAHPCALAQPQPMQPQSPADIARRVDDLLVKERPGAALPELCDDTTFLRRVSLDLIGKLPDAAEIDAFAKSTASTKRGQLVERLMKND